MSTAKEIEFRRGGPWEVPEGWVWARLGDVAEVNPNTSFDDLPDDIEIPFIPMAAMAEESGAIDVSQRRPIGQLKKGYTRFRQNDVLFAKITPCMENGKSAAVTDLPAGYGAGSTEFHVIRSNAFDPRYIWYWVVRQAFRSDAQRNMSGSAGQMRVPVDYLRNIEIAIPPLAEQGRIVARIDELFTEIADGETALARARDDLDTWRRALLKAAVTGELTREWREHNKPAVTGTELLTRLWAERITKVRIIGKKAATRECYDTSHLRELPQDWCWATLGELTANVANACAIGPFGSNLVVSDYRDAGVGLIFVRHIRARDFVGLSPKFVDTEKAKELSSHAVRGGDVLVTKMGEPPGDVAVYPESFPPAILTADCIKLTPHNFIPARWIEIALTSDIGQSQIRLITKGVAQQKITLADFRKILVPIPSEGEPAQIILAINKLQSEMIEKKDTHVDFIPLRQSVLKAAFEGRLVEQDPADEPAEQLLARLSECAVQSVSSRRARRVRILSGAEA